MVYVIVIVIGIFILAALLDWYFTKLFCYLRKKKYYKKQMITEGEIECKDKKSNSILFFLDGYILYKCSILQYIPSQRIRRYILRHEFQMDIPRSSVVYHGGEFRHPWKIKIGNGVSIGDHAKLDGRNGLVIEDNVNIGSGVWIWTEQHDYNDELFRCNDKGGMVVIREKAWVSSRVTVLPKVVIGEGTVIGAGAVVTKNCEDYSLYAGVPAKKIGKRNNKLHYSLTDKYLHFY